MTTIKPKSDPECQMLLHSPIDALQFMANRVSKSDQIVQHNEKLIQKKLNIKSKYKVTSMNIKKVSLNNNVMVIMKTG